jgi:hypothetical protein
MIEHMLAPCGIPAGTGGLKLLHGRLAIGGVKVEINGCPGHAMQVHRNAADDVASTVSFKRRARSRMRPLFPGLPRPRFCRRRRRRMETVDDIALLYQRVLPRPEEGILRRPQRFSAAPSAQPLLRKRMSSQMARETPSLCLEPGECHD